MNKYLSVPIKNSNKLLQFGQNLAWAETHGNINNTIYFSISLSNGRRIIINLHIIK